MEIKKTIPNAIAVLVLGICSIVFACLGIGLILGIIGLVLSSNGRKLYKESPNTYEGYGMLNAGFIMSIIGTSLGSIYVLYMLFYIIIIGGALATIFAAAH
jgi:hypothetical protein